MLNIQYIKHFAWQVIVIFWAPHITDLCALVSPVSFSKTSWLILILIWLAAMPLRLLIMSSEVAKATGLPVKCW